MKIQKIEKLKNNKYKILIDNESIITFDNVILDNNLLYKKEIDKCMYDLIIKDTAYYDVYNKVLRYILKRKRCELEVRQYLCKFNLNDKDLERIISKLKQNNFINDIEYCKSYINDNVYLSKNGINKVRIELLKRNIPSDVIESELKNIDTSVINSKLEKIIIKKINSNKKYSNTYLKQKILNEMINLGYDKEMILTILENNMIDNINIIKKEFEKTYNNLSKKYEGSQLLTNLKNKMLAKGFNISEINELIKEKTEE